MPQNVPAPANAHLDDRDAAILERSLTARANLTGPLEGDALRYSDGTVVRIAHVWHDEHGAPEHVQPAMGAGSYHLSDTGHMSMSGGLWSPVPAADLTPTDERRDVTAWFFHHGWMKAHNGINVTVSVPVWQIERPWPYSDR